MDRKEEAIAQRCVLQHGLVTRAQLFEAGLSSSAIDRRLASGRLIVALPRVYRLRSAVESSHQRILAACLSVAEGCAASHRSAAWLWGLDGFAEPPRVNEVSVRHGGRRTVEGFRVHQLRRGLSEGFVLKRGVPTTVLTRTILDLASVLGVTGLEIALDSAARGHPEFFLELDEFLCGLEARGRDGIGVLAKLVALRRNGEATGSAFETRLLQLVRRAGLPEPFPQYPVFDNPDQPFTFIDFAWPAQRIALFADGASYHLARRRARTDAWQRMKLSTLGWRPVVVLPKMLDDRDWIGAFALMFAEPAPLPVR